jgi:hypothetical protein
MRVLVSARAKQDLARIYFTVGNDEIEVVRVLDGRMDIDEAFRR